MKKPREEMPEGVVYCDHIRTTDGRYLERYYRKGELIGASFVSKPSDIEEIKDEDGEVQGLIFADIDDVESIDTAELAEVMLDPAIKDFRIMLRAFPEDGDPRAREQAERSALLSIILGMIRISAAAQRAKGASQINAVREVLDKCRESERRLVDEINCHIEERSRMVEDYDRLKRAAIEKERALRAEIRRLRRREKALETDVSSLETWLPAKRRKQRQAARRGKQ